MFDDRLETVLRTRARSAAGERTQFRQLLDLLGSQSGSFNGARVARLAQRAAAAPARELDRILFAASVRARLPDLRRLAGFVRLEQLRRAIPTDEQSRILRESGLRLRNPELVGFMAEWEPQPAASTMATARLTEAQWEALIPSLPVIARGFLRHRRDLPRGAVATLARLGVGDLALPDLVRSEPAKPVLIARSSPPLDLTAPMEEVAPFTPAPPEPALPPTLAPRPRPAAKPAPQPAPQPAPAPVPREPEPIGVLLERIEQFREGRRAPVIAPRLPLGDVVPGEIPSRIMQFDVVTDAAGRAVSASDPVAPLVTGMLLTAPVPGPLVQFDREVATALRLHQPVRAAPLSLTAAPGITGEWRLDAMPAFTPHSGAFTGYHCRLRRPVVQEAPIPDSDSHADRMRQVLHELRTPVGAIQGFAEIIQQQVFSQVPHAYRAHAAAIAVDAARLLAGFDELERLTRLETGTGALAAGHSDFRLAVVDTLGRLDAALGPREAGFALQASGGPFIIALDRGEALALCWRVLATIGGALGPGETVPLRLSGNGAALTLSCSLPGSMKEADSRALSASQPAAISAGMFGPDFAFRLAKAEVAAAGGTMQSEEGTLSLTLPVLTGEATAHSTGAPLAAG